jgi:NTP pyrophosphatase (non-canonical NTP hydrolase)
MSEIPRRIQLEKLEPAEHAIRHAVELVECMGADERLTRAVVLLGEAREAVADYVDGLVRDGGYGAIQTPDPDFFDLARAEMLRAQELHGAEYASLHEAYAVLLEEVDEVFDIVRQKRGERDAQQLLEELLQIAAVAGKAAHGLKVDGVELVAR